MKTCIEEGCDRPVVAKGLCSRHYQRLRRGSTGSKPGPKPKHAKEVREKFGGSPRFLVRMDLQLYDWVQAQGGAGWIRRCLELLRARWEGPELQAFRGELEELEEPEHYTFAQLAHRFGVEQGTLAAWIEADELPGRKAGQGWKIDRGDLAHFESTELPRLKG